MNTSSPRRSRWLALLTALLLLSALIPGVSQAQGPTPPPAETKPQARPPLNYEIVTPGSTSVTVSEAPPLADLNNQAAAPDAAAAEASVEADAPPVVAPEAAPVGPLVQGVVTLDVSAPTSIQAGEFITYTYTFQNNSGATVNGMVIKATWTDFGTKQYCPVSPDTPVGCVVYPGSLQPPTMTVTKLATCTGSSICYQVDNLGNGQTGQFSIRLRSKRDIYPKTNQAITRPAGSGQLYLNGGSTVISDDTAATIVIGPVLTLAKRAVDPTLKIYPLESAEFVITVGNATGTADRDPISGQIRADARPATNTIVKDTFPSGGSFVSSQEPVGISPPTVDTNARTVTWVIPGQLNPGDTRDLHVVFKKDDVASDCPNLNNSTYNATSDEYPINSGVARYVVAGPAKSVPVIAPLKVKSIRANPSSAPYGSESEITIVVQSFWNQPLTNVRLDYVVQSNATYVAGTASPPAQPNPPPGTVTWLFNMPAASKTAPAETSFLLRVHGGFTSTVQSGTGRAYIIPPQGANVPAACILPIDGRVNMIPRLFVTKYTDADPSTKIDSNTYGVTRLQEFPYTIDVTNNGPDVANGVELTDLFPSGNGANFTYVPGSSMVNGTQVDPTPAAGGVVWSGLQINPGDTLHITLRLKVDGLDYQRYCNNVVAAIGQETISYGPRQVCVKISPRIEMTKIIDKTTTTDPQDIVKFTVTLVNRETTNYQVGIVDALGEFVYDHQESSYDGLQPQIISGNRLYWSLVNLAPNTPITVVFFAKLPNICSTKDYINEARFYNAQNNEIRFNPPVTAKIRLNCGQIEYSKTSDRSFVSLGDPHIYTLQIKNTDGNPANNFSVVDVLPPGFTYISMDSGSPIKSEPAKSTTSDGRAKLTWTIPTIGANVTTNIKYVARSGAVVGSFYNLVAVPIGGKCVGDCSADNSLNDGIIYSRRKIDVAPLITMEPKITPDGCAQPGDIRAYQLTIVNTNIHDYSSTVVSVTLPLGLRYAGAVGTTPTPTVVQNSSGGTIVKWENLRIPAKPSNQVASQVVLEINLQVGQVVGNLNTLVQTLSPNGLIPRKEGVVDPTVPVCPAQSAIAKDVSTKLARIGDELIYQISLANTTATTVTATIEDQLAPELQFLNGITGDAPVGPAPNVSGNTLTWAVQVPPASNGVPGTMLLLFRVRVVSGAAGASVENRATASPADAFPDTSLAAVTVVSPRQVFVPIIIR